ncbi:glucosaminidase domain-containing protein [Alkalimarinus coralli]|uniref:glucosaminidase domain-containing protein n=1 Tax=Alkalimarinus coralli TaxID=2935863 RepID=UPI00202B5EAA|nr:glucosaminidase domain-containing protein [Alkalimarinus coralli]
MLTSNQRILCFSLSITLILSFFLGAYTATLHSQSRSIDTVAGILPNKPKTLPSEPLPKFTQIFNTQEKKQLFFSYLTPIIEAVNHNVIIERKTIHSLQQKSALTAQDKKYLANVAKKYRVTSKLSDRNKFFRQLLTKVDRIPLSLVLAQAANESAWGTSRFAVKGNNLFGQWCFSRGCGLVPERRSKDATHEVAKFDTVSKSVESYILNLNRHAEYAELREIRRQLRQKNTPVNGIQLANGLAGYSERGQDYVDEIKSMIRFNNLSSLDQKS